MHPTCFVSSDEVLALSRGYKPEWAFRGQSKDVPLKTSLQRACDAAKVPLQLRPQIERHLILDFSRRYDGPDSSVVRQDTMFCMALMQHHGAPTRLLDFTYSIFVAMFFALEGAGRSPVVWGVNTGWCREKVSQVVEAIALRDSAELKDDSSFRPCYQEQPRRFVLPENAFALNSRASAQQGVFLCQGDVRSGFSDNLRSLSDWDEYASVVKFSLAFAATERLEALRDLYRMNVSRAALFPGVDGFAQSLRQRLLFHLPGVGRIRGNA